MTRIHKPFGPCALAAFAVALFAAAPDAGAARQPGGERLAQLQERLNEAKERMKLTDEQVERMRPIFREGMEKQMAVLEKHGIDLRGPRDGGAQGSRQRGAARQNLRQLRELGDDLDVVRKETRKQLKDILSKEQFKEFKKIQEEGREEMRRRIRERMGGEFGGRRRARRFRD